MTIIIIIITRTIVNWSVTMSKNLKTNRLIVIQIVIGPTLTLPPIFAVPDDEALTSNYDVRISKPNDALFPRLILICAPLHYRNLFSLTRLRVTWTMECQKSMDKISSTRNATKIASPKKTSYAVACHAAVRYRAG